MGLQPRGGSTTRWRAPRRLAAALGLLGALALPSGGAGAERFLVGVEDSRYLPHYAFVEGQYRGFARDLLDAFFASRGGTPEYRAMPVARLFRSFLQGELDFKYPDNALWQAKLKGTAAIVYSDPIVAFIDGVTVLPERVGEGVEAIETLGTLRGFTATGWSQRLEAGQVALIENDSFRGLVEQGLIGRVDGVYANVDVVEHLLANDLKRPDALRFDETLPHTRGAYHLSTIAHPELIEAFNAWMKAEAALLLQLKSEHGLN